MSKLPKARNTATRVAVCVDNADYPASLELHKVYRISVDKVAEIDGDLRVIDESGEDYLYPAELFVVLEVPQSAARALKASLARTAK